MLGGPGPRMSVFLKRMFMIIPIFLDEAKAYFNIEIHHLEIRHAQDRHHRRRDAPRPKGQHGCALGCSTLPPGAVTLHFEIVDITRLSTCRCWTRGLPPSMGQHLAAAHEAWAATIAGFDAFVFVTPGDTHSRPGALKNAIDFLNPEWNNKAAGFVREVRRRDPRCEQLRLVMAKSRWPTSRTIRCSRSSPISEHHDV